MANEIDDFETKYPFDFTDAFLAPLVKIPNYWLVREKGGAFSEHNVEGPEKQKGELVETGLTNHFVLISVGAAHHHVDQLESILVARLEIAVFPIWRELLSFYNNLFGAREGLSKFCYLILDRKPKGINSKTFNFSIPQQFFKNKHQRLYEIFEEINLKIDIRHRLQHRGLIYTHIFVSNLKLQFQIPKDSEIMQRQVIPPKNIEWEDGLKIMKESLEYVEKHINQIYDYLLNERYIEEFLVRKNLNIKVNQKPT